MRLPELAPQGQGYVKLEGERIWVVVKAGLIVGATAAADAARPQAEKRVAWVAGRGTVRK